MGYDVCGTILAQFMVGGRQPITLSERDAIVSPERPEDPVIPEGGWVGADDALTELSTAFQLAHNLSRHFGDSERVRLEFSARNIRGRWLRFGHGDCMGPCRASTIQRKIDATAAEFRKKWLDYFAAIGKDFCDLFCRDGRVLSLADIKEYQNTAGNY